MGAGRSVISRPSAAGRRAGERVVDLAALKAVEPSEYQDAADGYRATSEMAGKAGEALDSRISAGIRNQLSGETAKAAMLRAAAGPTVWAERRKASSGLVRRLYQSRRTAGRKSTRP